MTHPAAISALLACVVLAPPAVDDAAIAVSPAWASITRSESIVFHATDCGVPIAPNWSTDGPVTEVALE